MIPMVFAPFREGGESAIILLEVALSQQAADAHALSALKEIRRLKEDDGELPEAG
jgi:hypothetical protein